MQQISLKIRNFQWICDAHAFSYCSIICLILRGDSELPSKTMCNSPFLRLRGRGRVCPARQDKAGERLWEGRGPHMCGPYDAACRSVGADGSRPLPTRRVKKGCCRGEHRSPVFTSPPNQTGRSSSSCTACPAAASCRGSSGGSVRRESPPSQSRRRPGRRSVRRPCHP